MLAELLGKGGQVCQAAKLGQMRCPLIVRPTSEDVITGHVFQVLRAINPRWWLPQFLNRAVGVRKYRQQVFRNLRIQLWRNAHKYPSNLIPWSEGSTQIDVTISWENPPTSILIEAKYLADLASRTRTNDGSTGFPADQLIRTIRIGLWEAGWLADSNTSQTKRRDLAVVLFSPRLGHPLVAEYRSRENLLAAIPHAEKIKEFPPCPFVGEASYAGLLEILKANQRWLTPPERRLAADLREYLEHKLAAVPAAKA